MKAFNNQKAARKTVMSDESLTTYLTANPRMIGVLFTLLVLRTQAGGAAAANMATVSGP